jgi:arsenate reductase
VIKIYQYPACSSCKKALAFLRDSGIPFEAVDISLSPPSEDELVEMIDRQGGIKPLFNTSGKRYREGGYSERIPTMSREDAVRELARDGMLVKRPFVITSKHALLGFKPDQWEKLRAVR